MITHVQKLTVNRKVTHSDSMHFASKCVLTYVYRITCRN